MSDIVNDKKNDNEEAEAIVLPPDLSSKLTPEEKFLYKKKGFFIALQNPDDHRSVFHKTLLALDEELERQRNDAKAIYDGKAALVQQWIDRLRNRLSEVMGRREHYEVFLRGQEKKKGDLEKEINKLCDDLFVAVNELGQKKSNVVSTQLESIEKEINKVVAIYARLENDYNEKSAQRHKEDEVSIEKKIKFWQQILGDLRVEYDKVLERIKNLSEDGINTQNTHFLIGLGWLSAFIAGWFFSVWAGKDSPQADGNLTGNSSVKFFFIDHVSQFLSQYPWYQVLGGVLLYTAIMGSISAFCYFLLKNYRKKARSTNKFSKDQQLNFDANEENLLSIKVKADNWWTFWLKITPFIVFIMPVLAIVANQLNKLKEEARKTSSNDYPTFQGLFDGMVNQLIGMFIAASLTTFMIIYLSRVSEHTYHNRKQASPGSFFNRIKIFHLGFIFFGLTIVCMIFYKFSFSLLADVRRVAILGFGTSSLAAAFGLGYGYIFKGLQENVANLLHSLRAVNAHVDYLSRPDRISFTGNNMFLERVDHLQRKMFELIESRHKLATRVNMGKNNSGLVLAPVVVQEQSPDKKKSVFVRFWQAVPLLGKKKQDASQDGNEYDKNFEAAYALSEGEVFYFAEQSQKIEALSGRIKEKRSAIRKIEDEINAYWRNEETYRSLNDQVKNVEKRIQHREHELRKINDYAEAARKNLQLLHEERKVWLNEGYFTGIWFDKNKGQAFDKEELSLN